jgi:hypothetical protein
VDIGVADDDAAVGERSQRRAAAGIAEFMVSDRRINEIIAVSHFPDGRRLKEGKTREAGSSALGTTATGSLRTVSISGSSTVTIDPRRLVSAGGQKPVYRYTALSSKRTPGSNWGASPSRSPRRAPSG